jgi:hypothetical protein
VSCEVIKTKGDSTGDTTLIRSDRMRYLMKLPLIAHTMRFTFHGSTTSSVTRICKMHRVLLDRAALESYIVNYGHTEYCGRMLLFGRDHELQSVSTIIRTKYATCEYVLDSY